MLASHAHQPRFRDPPARTMAFCFLLIPPTQKLRSSLRANINETFLAAQIREQGEKEMNHGWTRGRGSSGSGSDSASEAPSVLVVELKVCRMGSA